MLMGGSYVKVDGPQPKKMAILTNFKLVPVFG